MDITRPASFRASNNNVLAIPKMKKSIRCRSLHHVFRHHHFTHSHCEPHPTRGATGQVRHVDLRHSASCAWSREEKTFENMFYAFGPLTMSVRACMSASKCVSCVCVCVCVCKKERQLKTRARRVPSLLCKTHQLSFFFSCLLSFPNVSNLGLSNRARMYVPVILNIYFKQHNSCRTLKEKIPIVKTMNFSLLSRRSSDLGELRGCGKTAARPSLCSRPSAGGDAEGLESEALRSSIKGRARGTAQP